jgi:putative DNA primase/helicase
MVKKAGGSTSDVARLRGARFVAALETDSGQKLSEALIKQMTGSDTLAARFLYHEYFEFKPQFKLWLAANHKPGIGGTDEAIWRRVKLIPFEVTIAADERDPHMAERLREELPGILAWAVEGCLMWQAHGVGTCPAVERGTADYRSEMDVLAAFFTERCVVDKFSMVTAANLYAEYKVWCAEVGEEAQSQRWLGLRLTERGFKSSRKTDDGDKKTFWKGIGLDSAEKAGF